MKQFILPSNTEAGDTPEFLTQTQLLKRLPITRRTLFLWRKAGILPWIRIPRCRKVLFHWPTVVAALQRYQDTKS
jgi:hypothetical protein